MPRKPPARTSEEQSAAALARFDVGLASSVLVEAVIVGDAKAAAAFGINIRTVRSWRTRMASDTGLTEAFIEKARIVREHWADSLIPGILAHIHAGMEAVQSGIYDPLMFRASNESLRILLEAQYSLEILYARIRQYEGVNAGDADFRAASQARIE